MPIYRQLVPVGHVPSKHGDVRIRDLLYRMARAAAYVQGYKVPPKVLKAEAEDYPENTAGSAFWRRFDLFHPSYMPFCPTIFRGLARQIVR